MSRISRTRKIVLFWTAAALVAAVEAVLAAAFLVGEASPRVYSSVNDIPACKVGVVLGTSEYFHGHVSPILDGRIQAAAELYRAGRVQLLVVSGTCRPEKFYDEISAMAKKLIAQGVPEDVIVQDGKGIRTLDSILRMRDVFGYDGFITISQRNHCERALYLAKHHNISTIGFAAEIPSGQNLDEILFSAIRGPLARIKAVLDIAVNRTAKYPTER